MKIVAPPSASFSASASTEEHASSMADHGKWLRLFGTYATADSYRKRSSRGSKSINLRAGNRGTKERKNELYLLETEYSPSSVVFRNFEKHHSETCFGTRMTSVFCFGNTEDLGMAHVA